MLKNEIIRIAMAAAILASPASLADEVGETAELVGLRDLTSASDDVSVVRGSIFVLESAGLREYVWGGANCPNRDLAEDEVAILSRYLARSQVQITPYYKNGQLPTTRCLVGYTLAQRRYIDQLNPVP